MLVEAKILDPVCIRIGKDCNIVMVDKNNKETCPLSPGVFFGKDHYGFVLIVDTSKGQKEIVYPTQCKIVGAGMENGILYIYEDRKKIGWKFDNVGNLKQSAYNEFTDKFKSNFNIIVENEEAFMGKPSLKNPISIKISKDSFNSVILKDKFIDKDYSLYPGAIIGGEHYGFILLIDTEKGTKKRIYPTQNRIDAIGIEGNVFGDLKVYENGKYHPWVFTCEGNFEKTSSYNPVSKKDKDFVEDCYGLNTENKEYYTLQKKKK